MSCDPSWPGGTSRRGALELLGGLILLAMIPENPVVGGTVLRRAAIQSPNFLTGVSGWSVNQDGSAEFNNIVIRNGQIVSGTALYYSSSPPAFGTLIASVAALGGTDASGNAYLPGVTNYFIGGTGFAVNLSAGELNLYVAGGAGGPWTSTISLSTEVTGKILTIAANAVGGKVVITGACTINPSLAVSGGETLTGGLTADTAVISSGQAGGLLLQVTNTTGGATSELVRLTVNAAGDAVLGTRIAGDTFNRLSTDMTAGGVPRLNFGSGAAGPESHISRTAANTLACNNADLDINTIGRGLQIAEGANARMGTAVLVAGTKVVSNTSVTANTRIFLTCNTPGGTPGFLRVSARTAGTSFTILSSSGTDTSTVAWLLLEPG